MTKKKGKLVRREIVHLRDQRHWMLSNATCGQSGYDYMVTDRPRVVTCLKCKRRGR